MRVFITGATGYIGSVISKKLLAQGHQVMGLARSEAAKVSLHAQHITVHEGDLRLAASLAAGAVESDAVIHVAASREHEAVHWEREGVAAMLAVMRGTGKTFIYTSGASIVGATDSEVVHETHPTNPQNFRSAIEASVLNYAQQGVRVAIIRPSFVYGRGQGILPRYVRYAREQGIAGYVLPGDNHWPFVHVDDLADLYRLALEKAVSGDIFNATAGNTFSMLSISQTIAHLTGAKLTGWTPDEAELIIGRIAHILSINLRVSGQKAIEELNWLPSSPTVYEEIKHLSREG